MAMHRILSANSCSPSRNYKNSEQLFLSLFSRTGQYPSLPSGKRPGNGELIWLSARLNGKSGGITIEDTVPIPDGQVAKKRLHFFWLADCSDSMRGKKIATLNQAIREAVPEVQKALAAYPQVEIFMRAIKFSDDASWHVGPDPVPLADFTWPELETSGLTATAKAINLLTTELSIERMPRRGLPPVCILVSDGFCTDPHDEYDNAIAELAKIPWGVKAVRLAIAIGDESDYNEPELLKFVNQDQIGLLKAHSPEELVSYIKWASVSASVASSRGRSRSTGMDDTSNVSLESPPPMITSNTDLF